MIQAGLDSLHVRWRLKNVCSSRKMKNEWCRKEQHTINYVERMWSKQLAIALLIFFSKKSLSLIFFSSRKDSTVKKK